MKFKKLRKTILSTNRITLDITNNGKYLGYKSYKNVDDVPNMYNDCKVTTIYTRTSVALGDATPPSYLCVEVEVKQTI